MKLFKKENKETIKAKIPGEIVAQSIVDYTIAGGLAAASAGTILISSEMEKAGNNALALGGYLVGGGAGVAAVAMGVNATRRIIAVRKAVKEMNAFADGLTEGIGETVEEIGDVLDQVIQEHAESEAAMASNVVTLPVEEGVKVDG